MLHKRTDELDVQSGTDVEEESENESMTEGHKPKIYGINRKLIYGIVGIFLVAFLGSLYFNSSTDTSKTKKVAETVTPSKTQSPINSSYPGDYGGVSRMKGYDDQKTGRVATVNGSANARPLPRASNESVNTAPTASLPPIAARNYAQAYQPTYSAPYPTTSYPTAAPVQPATAASAAPQATAAEKIKENVKAAIQFALGKTDTEQEGKSTAVSQPTVTQVTYGRSSYAEASPNVLQTGTLIPAILVSGINSDVGGQVIAQVESDVYDSLYGSTLLIPAGSRLIGQYSAGAGNGQNRISITWGSLVMPDGGSYSLGNSMIAVDGAGYAGLEGNVDSHTGQVLSTAGLTSALAALGSVAAGNTGSSTNNSYSAGQLASQGAMSNLLNTASTMLQKNINVAPTITINPGYEFNVFVSQQISLNPYNTL